MCYTNPHFYQYSTIPCAISGQLAGTEETDGPSEDIPTSLEVGLLGHVRKVLMLMPDSLVHMVVGDVIQHVCLIAMANNDDIVVRTAAIRVSMQDSTSVSLYGYIYMYMYIAGGSGDMPSIYI